MLGTQRRIRESSRSYPSISSRSTEGRCTTFSLGTSPSRKERCRQDQLPFPQERPISFAPEGFIHTWRTAPTARYCLPTPGQDFGSLLLVAEFDEFDLTSRPSHGHTCPATANNGHATA